jgi:hypothetical protein
VKQLQQCFVEQAASDLSGKVLCAAERLVLGKIDLNGLCHIASVELEERSLFTCALMLRFAAYMIRASSTQAAIAAKFVARHHQNAHDQKR